MYNLRKDGITENRILSFCAPTCKFLLINSHTIYTKNECIFSLYEYLVFQKNCDLILFSIFRQIISFSLKVPNVDQMCVFGIKL